MCCVPFIFRWARGSAEENLHKMDQFSFSEGKREFSSLRSASYTTLHNDSCESLVTLWILWDFTRSSCKTDCQSSYITLKLVGCAMLTYFIRESCYVFIAPRDYVESLWSLVFQSTDPSRLCAERADCRTSFSHATIMASNNGAAQDKWICPVNCK